MSMKSFVKLIIFSLLFTSCASSRNFDQHSFSKRKHQKGHFWNKKSHYKTGDENAQNTEFEASDNTSVASESETKPGLEQESIISESYPAEIIDHTEKTEGSLAQIDELIYESDEKSYADSEDQAEEISQNVSTERKKSGKEEFKWFAVALAIAVVLFFLGLLTMLTWVILNALEAITGIILLIVGASMSGVSVLFFIYCLIRLIATA